MRLLPIRDLRVKLLLLSVMHLATDGLCAYLVFARLYPENPDLAFVVFLGYNALAFVTQSPLGLLIDKYNMPKIFLTASAVMILLGYISAPICLLATLFIGLGNSAFHVAGGKYISDKSGNDVSCLGIFVSTGAVGLALGNLYSAFYPLPYILFGMLLICLALILVSEDAEDRECHKSFDGGLDSGVAIDLVLAVVLARSFVGRVAAYDFTATELLLILIPVATALGKAVGGIASRLFGTVPTLAVSMLTAAVCLTLGTSSPIMYILGVFAFNFSMPMTLYYANIIMKGREGFAFGTLAAILFPGYILALSCSYSIWMRLLTAALCLGSVAVIILISRRVKNADCTSSDNNN